MRWTLTALPTAVKAACNRTTINSIVGTGPQKEELTLQMLATHNCKDVLPGLSNLFLSIPAGRDSQNLGKRRMYKI